MIPFIRNEMSRVGKSIETEILVVARAWGGVDWE